MELKLKEGMLSQLTSELQNMKYAKEEEARSKTESLAALEAKLEEYKSLM